MRQRAVTDPDRDKPPKTVLVAWCPRCSNVDYAFNDAEDAENHECVCTHCDVAQTLHVYNRAKAKS